MKKLVISVITTVALCLLMLMTIALAANFSGEENQDNPYEISSAEQLKEFAQIINGGNTGVCAVLVKDIDFGGETNKWTPTGNGSSFTGTFDGNGKTINGLYI